MDAAPRRRGAHRTDRRRLRQRHGADARASRVARDWGMLDTAMAEAFVQQIVYTATIEGAVAQVRITENGGGFAVIAAGVTVDCAQTREMVGGGR